MARFCDDDELFGDELDDYFAVFGYHELDLDEGLQGEFDVAVQEVIICIFTCLNVLEGR